MTWGTTNFSGKLISFPIFFAHLLNRPENMEEPQLEKGQRFSASQQYGLFRSHISTCKEVQVRRLLVFQLDFTIQAQDRNLCCWGGGEQAACKWDNWEDMLQIGHINRL